MAADEALHGQAVCPSAEGFGLGGELGAHAYAAGAAGGYLAFVLTVEIDQPPALNMRNVERVRADKPDFLVGREDAFEARVRKFLILEQREHHRDGDAVVCAETRAFGAYLSVLNLQPQRLRFEVEIDVLVRGADHVHMPLQYYRGFERPARRRAGDDDDVVRGVAVVLQAVFFGEALDEIGYAGHVAGAVGNGADALEYFKHFAWFKAAKNVHHK